MSESNKIYLGGAAGALLLALVIFLLQQPRHHEFVDGSAYQEQSPSYRPGGAACTPEIINSLSARLQQRQADACAAIEEQHREATNNFIASRRTADALEASANYAGAQARAQAWRTVIGLLTLIAAIAAAWFAKKAAENTEAGAFQARRTADAAEKTYNAFLAAEDAHLAVQFFQGSLNERVHRRRGIEPHNREMIVTNIGRSAAILHRYSVGDKVHRLDETLKRDESFAISLTSELQSRGPIDVRIEYSSAISPVATLIVSGTMEAGEQPSGVSARVTRNRTVTTEDEQRS